MAIDVTEILFKEVLEGNLNWWYLSFCDSNRPKGEHFLGACFVQGYGLGTASRRAHILGINPGGECRGAALYHVDDIPKEALNRLMSKEWMEENLGKTETWKE